RGGAGGAECEGLSLVRRRIAMGFGSSKTPEGSGNLRRRCAERRSAGFAQFLLAAEAPQRADGRNPAPLCAHDVVPAVAPHDALARIKPPFGENMRDQIPLVLEA